MSDDPDPRGLIRESFRIEGIDAGQCRSIFLDWALGLPAEADPRAAAAELLTRYANEPADHPMRAVLTEALENAPVARRRGGRAGRG